MIEKVYKIKNFDFQPYHIQEIKLTRAEKRKKERVGKTKYQGKKNPFKK